MPDKIEVKSDFKKLRNFIGGLGDVNGLVVKVGILTGGKKRKGAASNVAIGIAHEFGSYSKHIPQRSFLKMPITRKQDDIVKEVQGDMIDNLMTGDVQQTLAKLGIAAEHVVATAFQTGGFGTWASLKPATVERKKGHGSILVDTTQLERSITSKVAKR